MNSQLEPMEKGMGLSTPYIIQRECREPMRCILSFNSHKIIRSRVELKNSTHFGTCRSISQCTREVLLQIQDVFPTRSNRLLLIFGPGYHVLVFETDQKSNQEFGTWTILTNGQLHKDQVSENQRPTTFWLTSRSHNLTYPHYQVVWSFCLQTQSMVVRIDWGSEPKLQECSFPCK